MYNIITWNELNLYQASTSLPAFGDQALQDYIRALSQNVSSIYQAVQALHHLGLDHPLHSFLPGDSLIVKSWTDSSPLAEQWKGSFLVLMTHTAVKVAGICTWIHHTRPKTADPSEDSNYHWTVARGAEDELGLKLSFKQHHPSVACQNTKGVTGLLTATQWFAISTLSFSTMWLGVQKGGQEVREANFEAHRESVYKEDLPTEHHPVQLGRAKTLEHEGTTPPQNKWKGNKQSRWSSWDLEYQHTYSEYPYLSKTIKRYQLWIWAHIPPTGTQGLVMEAAPLEAQVYQIIDATDSWKIVGRCPFYIIKKQIIAKLGARIQHRAVACLQPFNNSSKYKLGIYAWCTITWKVNHT